jgi:hypothetical protein
MSGHPFKEDKPEKSQKPTTKRPKYPDKPNALPFTILGVTDNATCFFIGRNQRMIETNLSLLTKNNLLQLAALTWWQENFSLEGKMSWDRAIDFVVEMSSAKDFDNDKIRGRGAWIDGGNICYHDGKVTTGNASNDVVYLRKREKNIGIATPLPRNGLAKDLFYSVEKMSFETEIDAIRLVAWSLLAPFAGALPWRPAILLTGESGSGKSTVIDKIVKPLAAPVMFSGGVTSEAGVRQKIKNDASAIVIEESETDTNKKKRYREDLFSLMRQSTTNDAPSAAKGTRDGRGTSFKLRSMFLFAAISPEVESVADDNRIFLVNMKKTDGSGWLELERSIDKYINPTNCASIRAFVWRNLSKIIKDSHRYARLIQEVTKRDRRTALADGLLFSAFLTTLGMIKDDTDEQIKRLLEHYYKFDTRDRQRNETHELVKRLLDERVLVDQPTRQQMTLRNVLIGGYIGKFSNELKPTETDMLSTEERTYLKSMANALGVGMDKDNNLMIANNHHEIQKILGKGSGYQRQLYRHEGLIERGRAVNMSGTTRRCVVVRGVLEV